jgi:hypothetical protein
MADKVAQTRRKATQIQPSGPVRISLPASVAYNVDALQKSIAEIVDRLGCTRCFSGANCVFQLERDWVVNPKLGFQAVLDPEPDPWRFEQVAGFDPTPTPLRIDRVAGPDPTPWKASSRAASVSLAAKVAYNLADIQKVVAEVAGRLGHPQCFSGFDVGFGLEQQLVMNEQRRLVG